MNDLKLEQESLYLVLFFQNYNRANVNGLNGDQKVQTILSDLDFFFVMSKSRSNLGLKFHYWRYQFFICSY